MALTASHCDSNAVQMWDNAAFVHAADDPSHDSRLLMLESDARKENQSPNMCKSPATTLQGKQPLKILFKQGLLAPLKPAADDVDAIDSQIDAIEKEMARLSERLTALHLQKEANRNPGIEEAGVEIVSVKQSSKTPKVVRIQASPGVTKSRPRGVSMCPAEIAGVRLMQPTDKPENRRKSCFWKLPPLAEEEVGARDTKPRRLSLVSNKNGSRTLSPKTRPSKIPDPRRGISTVGSKILGKRDEATLSRLQPKKLFGDGSSSVSKPLKNARVVASRYNQIPARGARRSPEKERRKKSVQDRKSQGAEISGRDRGGGWGRKTWGSGEDQMSSTTSSCTSASTTSAWELEEMVEGLPRINVVRLVEMSPRDSGCAKRVVELEGKRSYFSYEPAEEGGARL